jgi:hypothetical protein
MCHNSFEKPYLFLQKQEEGGGDKVVVNDNDNI